MPAICSTTIGAMVAPDRSAQPNDVPLIPWANHYAVSATVTASRDHPLGRLVGDFIVQPDSARGQSRDGEHIPFPVEHTRHFGGIHHFNLLNHPTVYEALREWLDPTSAATPSLDPL